MPIYEYQCTNCGEKFEFIESFSAPTVRTCKYCNGEAKRIISLANFQLKGTGWYATDYKDKGKGKEKEKGEDKDSAKTD